LLSQLPAGDLLDRLVAEPRSHRPVQDKRHLVLPGVKVRLDERLRRDGHLDHREAPIGLVGTDGVAEQDVVQLDATRFIGAHHGRLESGAIVHRSILRTPALGCAA
jgi:hypothetical protein